MEKLEASNWIILLLQKETQNQQQFLKAYSIHN